MPFECVQIGDCTLYRGDCLEILPTLAPGSVDAVVTDPPYEIDAIGNGIAATRQYLLATAGFTDCGFDYSVLDNFDNWVCFGTLRQVPKLIEKAADRRHMLITWNKTNPCPLINGNYLPDTEYAVHAWRTRLYGGIENRARFIVHPTEHKQNGEHPNQKPIRVLSKLLCVASDVGHMVLDPFMGSGTTGVACVQLGRKFIGIEIDPHWFEVACARIESAYADRSAPLFGDHAPKPEQLTLDRGVA